MDLFHTVTQGLDTILTCHWYEQVKNFDMSGNSQAKDKTMETVPGGEQTQYEGAVTENVPAAKQTGQLGSGAHSTEPGAGDSVSEDRAKKTTENIRYGQNISESGVGGMTTTSSGSATQGGYGGEVDSDRKEEKPEQTRREQGYGPGSGVGA